MNINKLITPRNQALYDRVQSNFKKIQYAKSKDSYWSSNVDGNNIAHISYAKSNHEEASFVHELLHLDVQSRGYKRLRVGMSAWDNTPFFKRLMSALDNELQHHKMYKGFLHLGYAPNEFYADSDVLTEKRIIKNLMQNSDNIRTYYLDFLTLIAPGGSISEANKEYLLKAYKAKNSSKFAAFFEHVQSVFLDWEADSDFNAEPYLMRLFNVVPGGEFTWFGYGKAAEFPNNGFFVDKEFEIAQPST
ncbi:hypothetical protein Q5H92_13750 [Hymenobacter sp. M29]|uniref:Uncharacterized protein n=1 Tax=Hymenobacter mellowenesis TaxID=3063995 RepID=A0ABT9ADI7_9BACT|nr:hypothetical protein [Hymenobacter sp. M29]MDO7847429.1 hypothetical protein [Hymenobacter sp. M29]